MKKKHASIYNVVTTFETREQAQKVIDTLISQRLIACASISPIFSTYRWDNRVVRTDEFEVSFKVLDKIFFLFKSRLLDLHPYQVPQFLVFKAFQTTDSYELWMDQESMS